MTLDDLRELVRITAKEHGDNAASIAKTVAVKDRVMVWKWMNGRHVHHWPDWVSAYLERRGVLIVVRRVVARKETLPKHM